MKKHASAKRPATRRRGPWSATVLTVLVAAAGPVAAAPLTLVVKARQVSYADVQLDGAAVTLSGSGIHVAVDAVRSAAAADWRLRAVALQCGSLRPAPGFLCADGAWNLQLANTPASWVVPVSGSVTAEQPAADIFRLAARIELAGFVGALEASVDGDSTGLRLAWEEQPLQRLPATPWSPEMLSWIRAGWSSGQVKVDFPPGAPGEVATEIRLRGLAFDSPDGRHAAEALAARLTATFALPGDGPLRARMAGQLEGGELLVDAFYANFSEAAIDLAAGIELADQQLKLTGIRVDDGTALSLEADVWLDLQNDLQPIRYQVQHLEMHFPEAYGRYLESVAAAHALDGLTMTGSVFWTGPERGGLPGAGVLDVLDLSIVDTGRGRFAVTGVDGHLRAGQGQALERSRLAWRGLLLGQINLGPAAAALDIGAGRVVLAEALHLGVLGGTVSIEQLELALPGLEREEPADADIAVQVAIGNLDMRALTTTLGWPVFEGRISGRIPGVSLDEGVLAVDGEVVFRVFDGDVRLNDLRIERLFGVLPSLAGNLEVDNLDLLQLTQAFSVGRISGRLDGYMHDLRMLDWQPVEFDAWFGTPEDQRGTQKISRNAVSALTSIGGGGATEALSGPLLSLFSNFSYRRLGIGCRLENYVCQIRGLDSGDEPGILLMEGAGLPKVMIRAYNRRLDWPQLLANLAAASAGGEIRIGDEL